MKTFITSNFTQTQNLGKKLAGELKSGRVVALYGNLGSGKTTFVQGLAKGLGIKSKIISPTFIIVRKYEIKPKIQDPRSKNFYHIDLYRIESEADITGLGLEEIINDSSSIIAVEWPEKIKHLLPAKMITVNFKYLIGDKREIQINIS